MRAAMTVVVSDALGDIAREEGGTPLLVPLAADSFPAPAPGETVVAVSRDTSATARTGSSCARSPRPCRELILLLIGEWHADESGTDPDFASVPASAEPRVAGASLGDEEAARLILLGGRGDRAVRALRAIQRHRAAVPHLEVRAAGPANRLTTVSSPR